MATRYFASIVASMAMSIGACASPPPPAHHAKHAKNQPAQPTKPVASANLDDGVKYIEDCNVHFHDAPSTAIPETSTARMLAKDAERELSNARTATTSAAYIEAVKAAIEHGRIALVNDPYNPTLTLDLALAYDMAFRKGCALGLLKRLAVLGEAPTTAEAASRAIDGIAEDPSLFHGYRKDALAAAGR